MCEGHVVHEPDKVLFVVNIVVIVVVVVVRREQNSPLSWWLGGGGWSRWRETADSGGSGKVGSRWQLTVAVNSSGNSSS